MKELWDFLNGIPWYAWIAIVAIMGEVTVRIIKMSHRHDERMALIKSGQNPDGRSPS